MIGERVGISGGFKEILALRFTPYALAFFRSFAARFQKASMAAGQNISKKNHMSTVTRENIGLLNDKIIVKIEKSDYLPSFEKSLKEYGKKANIPGFRKGMVPTSLIKKMYGNSVFTDEVLKRVEKKLTDYISTEQLEIFAQPLPLPENDASKINYDPAR